MYICPVTIVETGLFFCFKHKTVIKTDYSFFSRQVFYNRTMPRKRQVSGEL